MFDRLRMNPAINLHSLNHSLIFSALKEPQKSQSPYIEIFAANANCSFHQILLNLQMFSRAMEEKEETARKWWVWRVQTKKDEDAAALRSYKIQRYDASQ